MEKSEITSLDLRFLTKELKNELVGGLFRKIYQYPFAFEGKTENQFLFEIFVPGRGERWLYIDKNKLFLTTYKKPSPREPPSFCLFLRKHLNNRKILDLRQHSFDRIVEIRTAENRLYVELFSDGNLILCDNENRIIMPLYVQRWRDRELKPKIPYAYPPPKPNPFAMNFDYFHRYLSEFDRKVIAVLAAGLGFGKVYAKEICVRAKVDENIPSNRLSLESLTRLYETIKSFDTIHIEPTIYENFVSPFPLVSIDEKPKRTTQTFSEALDEFFSHQQIQLIERKKEEIKQEQQQKLHFIIQKQQEALEKWKEKWEETKSIGDIIYSHYGTVESVIESINRARASGLSWEEIKKRIHLSDTPEASMIQEIREDEGIVVIELEGKRIEIDFRKSVEENAAEYYERSKKALSKAAGVLEAMDERKEITPAEPTNLELYKPVKVVKKRKKWFERFRWFRTSDWFLVVAGKDAETNETLVKKHLEPSDLVFHSDIHGAPFVVVKAEGRIITDEAKKEAAEFAAAYSKAWAMGLATVDVYAVRPDQVTKQPPSGEYLPKGSFMIYGGRKWFRDVDLRLSIGMRYDEERDEAIVMAGPVMAVRKQTDYFTTIKPGETIASQLAVEIKNKILIKAKPEDRVWIEKVPISQIERFIPFGKGEIVEYG